jgi:hypothetical protein
MQGHPPCPRCYAEEELVRPFAGSRLVCRLWKVGMVALVVCGPILASDIVVMMPLSMAYLFAGGPILALGAECPTCRVCGLARPSPGWHETPCRPVRDVSAPLGSRLRLRPTERTRPGVLTPDAEGADQARLDEDSGVRALPTSDSRPR